ncbi:MAG: hypothetical protein ACM31C_17120 [Acidobacteriota bacterium]
MRALLVLILLAGNTYAQDSKGPHAEGDYGGVVPGQPSKAEPPAKGTRNKRPPPKGTLAWIGFEAKNGGSQIFLQSVAPFEVSQRVENGVLVVNLTGLTKLGHNTWRLLDTRFFETPIARIVARYAGATKAHKGGIELRVTFKNPKEAKEGALRTATEADGYFYAYLTFGGGTAPATMQEPEK